MSTFELKVSFFFGLVDKKYPKHLRAEIVRASKETMNKAYTKEFHLHHQFFHPCVKTRGHVLDL